MSRGNLNTNSRRGRLSTNALLQMYQLRNVVITDSARANAKQKISSLKQERISRIARTRPASVAQKIRLSPKKLDLLYNQLGQIKSEISITNQKIMLQYWGQRAQLINVHNALLRRTRLSRHKDAHWPTRFMVTTKSNRDIDEIKKSVQRAFGIDNYPQTKKALSVSTLFKKFKTKRYFVVELSCRRRETARDASNIASALKTACQFESVRLESTYFDLQINPRVDGDSPPPNDTEWHLRNTRVKEAWALTPPASGGQQGEGIVIGHPDSGWRPHPEYDEISPYQNRIDTNRAYNVFDGTTGPDAAIHETSPQWMLSNLTHGTATGSMMVSAAAADGSTWVARMPKPLTGADANIQITGVAPRAQVLPIKCIESVALLGDTNVARAIDYAANEGVDVISLSLGGTPYHALEDRIREAVTEENIIVIAAAGQINNIPDYVTSIYHNTVIEPAAYPEVIAVGGSTIEDKPWADSFRGEKIDVCAPAFNVWFADFDEDGGRKITYGSGTSFSAAQVASIAALWLAFHGGKTAIVNAYPNRPVAEVFRHLLKQTARQPRVIDRSLPGTRFDINEQWNETLFGAGIVNAEALLSAALPDEDDVTLPPLQESNFISWIQDNVERGEEAAVILSEFSEDVLVELEERVRESSEFAQDLITTVALAAAATAQEAAQELADRAEAAVETALALAESATDNAKQIAEELAEVATEAWEDTKDSVEEIAEDIAEKTDDAIDSTADVVEDIVDTSSETAEAFIDAITPAWWP